MFGSPRPEPGRLLVALGLGSNLPPLDEGPFRAPPDVDPRLRALEGSLVLLDRAGWILRGASRVFDSDPVGVDGGHGPFLNAAALLDAPDRLDGLLETTAACECAAGRRGRGDLAPRPLDVDVLAAWRCEADRLVPVEGDGHAGIELPHPRAAERGFVLVPLAELVPDLRLAANPAAPTVRELLARLGPRAEAGLRPGPASRSFGRRVGFEPGGRYATRSPRTPRP